MAVMLETSRGDLVVDLFTEDCPQTTKNFLKLCKYALLRNPRETVFQRHPSLTLYVLAESNTTTMFCFTMCKQTLLFRPVTRQGLARAETQCMGKQHAAVHICRSLISDACLRRLLDCLVQTHVW